MFCTGCEEQKEKKDFMLDHLKCYRCIYREKLKVYGGRKRRCKICHNFVKDNRKSYCSNICADIALEKHRITRYGDRLRKELQLDQQENSHKYSRKYVTS